MYRPSGPWARTRSIHARRRRASAFALAIALAVAGCATRPPDDAAASVRSLVEDRTGAQWPEAAPAAGGAPLSGADALRLALWYNPRFRAELAGLGVADADLARALTLPNPQLFASLRFPSGAGANNVEFGLSQDVMELLVRPTRRRLAEAEYARAREEVAGRVLSLALDVGDRYVAAVAARQRADLRQRMAQAERLADELAGRFRAAGNTSPEARAAARVARAEAEVAASQASAASAAAAADLQRVLAVPGGTAAWTLPAALPAPAGAEPPAEELVARALERRPDLAAARRNVAALDEAIPLARRWRWTGGVLNVGVDTEKGPEGLRVTGPNVTIGLPLFDRGQAQLARLQARREQVAAEAEALEAEVRSDTVAARAEVEATRQLAAFCADELVPAREEAVRQLQLQQNYMLVGVFEVLDARQRAFAADERRIEALRDYWLARGRLARATGGAPLPDAAAAPVAQPAPAAQPDASHEHHVH